ncbi:MAG: tetratricopeptide repeat protein [Phycisphaeraceae bacterium]
MAEASNKPTPGGASAPASAAPVPAAPPARASWAQVWQLPALFMGLGLFAIGIYVAKPKPVVDDFHGALESVRQYILAEQLDVAQEILDKLAPSMERAAPTDQAWSEELWGDLIYHQQKQFGQSDAAVSMRIINNYRAAANGGRELDDLHLERLAESLVVMQMEDEALAVLRKLKRADAAKRYGILRTLITQRLSQPAYDATAIDTFIQQYMKELAEEKDAAKKRDGDIWAHGVMAQILFDGSQFPAAIELIERKLIMLMDKGGAKDLAPLHVLRAKAYLQIGQFGVAKDAFVAAQAKLPPADPLNAEVLVGLGQIELIQTDDVRAAWQHFKLAEQNYRSTDRDPARSPYMDALIGRADCEGRMGQHAEALANLELAVRTLQLRENPAPPSERRDRVIHVALAHHVSASDLEQFDTALAYLKVLKPLHGDQTPAAWSALAAVTHERIATKLLHDAGLPLPSEAVPGGGSILRAAAGAKGGDLSNVADRSKEALRVIRQEAARHFEEAAKAYADHARKVGTANPKAAADSMWAAGGAFDNAFRWQRAAAMYEEFITSRGDDPRRPDAMYRIGISHLAGKSYEQAIKRFTDLRQQFPTHKTTLAALVPMARAMIDSEKSEEATRLLVEIVTNHPAITPQSLEYRDALIMLGRLYHATKDYENAIQRLAMAVERYGETNQGAELRFLLAESYRQSIAAIDQTLSEPLPQSKVREFQAERARRLDQALILHSQVVTQLGEMDQRDLTPIQLLYFRNAYFYRADCAFDLRRFEQAIELYDAAARRWHDHPASLVALVQMVNSYAELGQYQNARAVNLRARDHLRRIPEEAFNDPSLPMTRKHWQDWLTWSGKLNLFDEQASADGNTPR